MRRKDREVTEISAIEAIMSQSDVCRIAFAVQDVPYIVTMNFGYKGGENPCLYFHCAPEGRKLDMMLKNSRVCFQMDTDHNLYGGDLGCDWGMKFSSIIGYGILSIVTDKDERIRGLNNIMSKYAGSRQFDFDNKILERTTILRLDISQMTGKKR